jgi:predicted XRE-type DNA-binding protein
LQRRAKREEEGIRNRATEWFIGSPNVFKDIGLPNAAGHLVKAQLVFKIDAIMKDRDLKQVEAAGLFGVKQPDVSKMLRGEFRQFSVETPAALPRSARSGCRDRREAAPGQK